MRHILTIALFAIFAAGCGGVIERKEDPVKSNFDSKAFPAVKNSIYGAWETVAVKNQPDYRMFFNQRNQVGIEMICDEGVGDVRASAIGNARIEASSFSVLQNLSGKAQDQKGNSCSFSWGPYQSVYSIVGEVLTISGPDGSGARSLRRMW